MDIFVHCSSFYRYTVDCRSNVDTDTKKYFIFSLFFFLIFSVKSAPCFELLGVQLLIT